MVAEEKIRQIWSAARIYLTDLTITDFIDLNLTSLAQMTERYP